MAAARAAAAIPNLLLFPTLPTSSSPSSSYSPHRTTSASSLAAASISPTVHLSHRLRRRHFVRAQLPTSREGTGNNPKWSARAVKSFALGQVESHKLKFAKVGTESLLMGILVEGTSEAAKFLRANGINIMNLREQTLELLGKAEMYSFTDLSPLLTQPALKSLDWAIDEKLKSGEDGEVTATHLLLGIWAQKDTAGHMLMASFGFDDDKASLLAKSANQDVIVSLR